MRKLLITALGITMVAIMVGTPSAFAQAGTASDKGEVKVGYLSCHVASGWGIIFGSSRELDCTFTPTSGDVEHYKGEITKFGADIGYLQSAVILWTVLAPSTTIGKGALAGHYGGVTAGVTVGLGAGVHALLGGLHSTIALQPLSIEGNTGLNVGAGVATMNLDYVMPRS